MDNNTKNISLSIIGSSSSSGGGSSSGSGSENGVADTQQQLDELKACAAEKNSIADVQFNELFDKAISIFKAQADASLGDAGDGDDVSFERLELMKAKANNVLDSIGNVLELRHIVDVIKSDHLRFKRVDELKLLNRLKGQCEAQAELNESCINAVRNRMLEAYASEEGLDEEELDVISGMLERGMGRTDKLVGTVNKLIKLERDSGNRAWGQRQSSSSGNINYIKGLKDAEGDGYNSSRKAKPRLLSPSELVGLGNDE